MCTLTLSGIYDIDFDSVELEVVFSEKIVRFVRQLGAQSLPVGSQLGHVTPRIHRI